MVAIAAELFGELTLPAVSPGASIPAVVVLPPIAGVNDYIRRVVARLVGCGFAVYAIDYYGRSSGPPDLSTPDRIMQAVAGVRDDEVVEDVRAAVGLLGDRPEVDGNRVGLLGMCVGGSLAMVTASRGVSGVACAAAFYGLIRYQELTEAKPVSPLDAVEGLDVPFIGHWGDSDHLVPVADVEALRTRLRGRPAEIYLYPGAGHGFHEDARPVYRPVAAAEAWARTVTYLQWYLRAVPV